jgi:V/A-type H+-transporting ATPase subunit A
MSTRTGNIQRIAGPLIEADGLRGVTMFEVCRVGTEELIGEVNRVVGDRAYIQVYEETSGLKPGEPVVATGTSLDVELGPGLVGSIFDGIQRPLPSIKQQVGDFITRGVTAPPLPVDKSWTFKPNIEKGETVSAGDVIGTVQETSVFLHRILIPPGIEGKVTQIVNSDDYTIKESIAQIQTASGKRDIKLTQRWPVRIGRPYKSKISTEVPLYTGQRVIDTFFPVAKGGTGAIPGGFGTGKCVTGDTPVLLSNGDTIPIQVLYKKSLQRGEFIEQDTEDETLIRLKTPIRILSFDGERYIPTKATHIYRGTTPALVKITTRSGRTVEVTPIHKLFRFNGEIIEEVEAQQLNAGDHLVVPRKLNISGQIPQFDSYEIDLSLRVVDPQAIQMMQELIQDLHEQMTLKDLSKKLEVSYDVLISYKSGKNKPTLRFLDKLVKFAGKLRIPVTLVKAERGSEPFRIPTKLTKELSEWLGLFVADGHFKGKYQGIYLYNSSPQILDRFKELSLIVFDLEPKIDQDSSDRTPYAYIRNTSLKKFLISLDLPREDKSHTVRVPSCIRIAPEDYFVHFLTGYIAGDGHFSKYSLHLSTVSHQLHSDLGYLLTRLGIIYRARPKKASYVINIDGKFAERISKCLQDNGVYPYAKIQRLYEYASQEITHFIGLDLVPINQQLLLSLKTEGKTPQGHDVFRKTSGLRLDNYTRLDETPSNDTLRLIFEVINSNETQVSKETTEQLQNIMNLLEQVYFDRIKKIEITEANVPVYDITVEKTHNFVGGVLPVTLHNTVTLHQLAKWADADIIVYVGCGERGNEMTEVLEDFPKLKDPKSGKSLMERTILVANTSNMPVAAREASIYTGITLAEYFRDQGYDVALMADSTSRWAEALREISGRLEEMPGEEGYPAYLGSRLAEFYERAGRVETLGSEMRLGSVTVTGAVSPAGGDFSEPVTQSTLRITKVFWALDKDMASRRFFPAINYLQSYSLYKEDLATWYQERMGNDWPEITEEALSILQRDKELREIVQLVGPDALPERERAILEAARMVKEDYLMQSALHPIDTYCPESKSYWMLKIIMEFWNRMMQAIDEGILLRRIIALPVVGKIARMKVQPHENPDAMLKYFQDLESEINKEFISIESD